MGVLMYRCVCGVWEYGSMGVWMYRVRVRLRVRFRFRVRVRVS